MFYFTILFLLFNLIWAQYDISSEYNKFVGWYEKYQNEKFNGINFNKYITSESAIELVNNIHNQISNNQTHIFIVLDTDGGDLVQTYNIINWMDLTRLNANIKFHCVCIKAYSSGFFIFQLCDYRYWILNQSHMMTHEPKINIEGTFDFVSAYVNYVFSKDYHNYKTILDRIYLKTNLNQISYINKISIQDWIINSSLEAKIYNLADFYIDLI